MFRQRPRRLNLKDLEYAINGFTLKIYLDDNFKTAHTYHSNISKGVAENEFSLFVCEQTIHVYLSSINNIHLVLEFLDKNFLCEKYSKDLKFYTHTIFKKYINISKVFRELNDSYPGMLTIVDETTIDIHTPITAKCCITPNRNLLELPKELQTTYEKMRLLFNTDLQLIQLSLPGKHPNQDPKTHEFCLGVYRFKPINKELIETLHKVCETYNLFNCYYVPGNIKKLLKT